MRFFEKEAKIKIPEFVKSYSPVIGMGAFGATAGALAGSTEGASFSPLKGAIGGAVIGSAYGGVVKRGLGEMGRARAQFEEAFKGFGGSGRSYGSIGKKMDLGSDLKNLHLNKSKIKTKLEVKKQYRNMARRYHPDVNPKGEEKFKNIAASWENIQKTNWYEKLSKFDPKRLIGPAVGAASLGALGYATAEKEDKVTAGITAGILGGVVGLAFKGKRSPLSSRKSFFEGLGEKMNPLDETEKVLEKSRRAMEELDKRKMAVKTHTTTKSGFKYKDALKMTKEKKAAFFAEVTKLAKASKTEATIYTGAAGAAGAYGGLRAGEAFAKGHTKMVAEDVASGGYKTLIRRSYGEKPMEFAARVSKRAKRFGAIAGGALGAGTAANYFIRKNI